jgi:hypothetical protein
MATIPHAAAVDPPADPFGERLRPSWRRRVTLLGARIEFEGRSRELLQLVDEAYAGLPAQHARRGGARLKIGLQLVSRPAPRGRREPPPLRTLSGPGGLLCGMMDESNFVLLAPQAHAALIVVSRDMLRHPYHVRYELIEFAVFTLAARMLGLVPLHAACVGRGGRGLLLIGASGAGKSTLALHCALQGTDLLAEDAVFVEPRSLLASGVANFVYVRRGSLRLIDSARTAARIARSRVIRRRSGIAKFEVDLRRLGCRIARTALRIEGIVFLSTRQAAADATLRTLSARQLIARLRAAQPYSSGLPSWAAFRARLAGIAGYELRRGGHPAESAVAIRHLLERRRLRGLR